MHECGRGLFVPHFRYYVCFVQIYFVAMQMRLYYAIFFSIEISLLHFDKFSLCICRFLTYPITPSCPPSPYPQISGFAATITYIVDGVFKLLAYRQKSRAERIASSGGDGKVEEPYVDEVQSPTETVATTEDESQPAETKSPSSD